MNYCRKCGQKIGRQITVDGKRRNLKSRKFCLACSPFGQHNTKADVDGRNVDRLCSICKRRIAGPRRRRCPTCDVRVHKIRMKMAAVRFLGGKCSKCGWHRHLNGLVFHHLRNKEFGVANLFYRSWAMVKRELAKCQLLCANCHQVVHQTPENHRLMVEARAYKGPLPI